MEKFVLTMNDLPATYLGGSSFMIRKLLYSISLASLLVIGAQLSAQPSHTQSDSGKQSKPATKSVSGKVTSIGNSGTSFEVQVEGSSNQTMEFVVNNKTQVQGKVSVGTLVAVDYQPIEGGQNLAVSIAVRS
jgi:hypothetical protein